MDRALIIDDSKAIRSILGSTIKSLGFEVSEAEDGLEALDQLKRLGPPVRLLLVDWNMPKMNGLEFVKELRARSEFDSSKVMMVTTETALDQMVTALEAGADEYIMKPFTDEVVLDKLRLLGIVD